MKINFTKYKCEYSDKDLEYAKDKNLWCTKIYMKARKGIVIFPDYPKNENYLAIIFFNNSTADKYVLNLADKKYNEILFALLCEYSFGDSKLQQLEHFNQIQETIIDYYKEKDGYKEFYQEAHKNSIIYSIMTAEFPLPKKIIRSCLFDIDALFLSLRKKIETFNKIGVFEPTGVNYVYLMHDERTKLFKIGFSKKIKHREKTLQSEEPKIELFRQWHTSQKYESTLKRKFKNKRVRGEWFRLDKKDIDVIDKMMKKFNPTFEEGLTKGILKMLDRWQKQPIKAE